MLLNIGETLAFLRKEKKITQQELADFVGVTKASVSKWENGQSYPDITLLPLLAAYFDQTIDELLNYQPQLTTHEIQRIYHSLQGDVKKAPAETLVRFRNLVKRYYSCYPFLIQMSLFLLNHGDQLPYEEKNGYQSEAQQLLDHVIRQSQDPRIVAEAEKLLAYISLIAGENERVLALLGEWPPVEMPAAPLIAAAYQQQDPVKATAVMQSAIYQELAIMMSFLTNYLQILGPDPVKTKATVQRGEQLAMQFELASLNPINYLNFLAAAIVSQALVGNKSELTRLLQRFITLLETTPFPTALHGDAYFDQIEGWLEEQASGNQYPRETTLVKQDFLTIIEFPMLQVYQTDAEVGPLLKILSAMKGM